MGQAWTGSTRRSSTPARLIKLEWAYLPLFRFEHRTAGVLQRALAQEPEFFVQMLSFAFRARGEEPVELSEGEQNRAQNAHALLQSWQVVPGTQDDGTVDSDALDAWVVEARRLLADANRSEIGEQYIGRVFPVRPPAAPGPRCEAGPPRPTATCPAQPSWTGPPRPSATPSRAAASDDLETGFALEVYNSRGVTSRGMTDGGDTGAVSSHHLSPARNVRRGDAPLGPRRCSVGLRCPTTRDAERYDRDAALTEDTWR